MKNEIFQNLIFRDIQHVHDMGENDAKEAYNIRLFIQSLHDASYQHRFEYIFKFELNEKMIFFFVLVEVNVKY